VLGRCCWLSLVSECGLLLLTFPIVAVSGGKTCAQGDMYPYQPAESFITRRLKHNQQMPQCINVIFMSCVFISFVVDFVSLCS